MDVSNYDRRDHWKYFWIFNGRLSSRLHRMERLILYSITDASYCYHFLHNDAKEVCLDERLEGEDYGPSRKRN
jgi:hypothetical protein